MASIHSMAETPNPRPATRFPYSHAFLLLACLIRNSARLLAKTCHDSGANVDCACLSRPPSALRCYLLTPSLSKHQRDILASLVEECNILQSLTLATAGLRAHLVIPVAIVTPGLHRPDFAHSFARLLATQLPQPDRLKAS